MQKRMLELNAFLLIFDIFSLVVNAAPRLLLYILGFFQFRIMLHNQLFTVKRKYKKSGLMFDIYKPFFKTTLHSLSVG